MSGPAPHLVAVMGTTASGKTRLAEALADRTGYQLINADAFQVYRWMDIGTAKSERRNEYLLMDLVDPWEPFGAGEWINLALGALESLYCQGRGAIVVGGTLYYVRALFDEFADMRAAPDPARRAELENRTLDSLLDELRSRDPQAASRVDPHNRVRVQRAVERLDLPKIPIRLPPFQRVNLGLDPDPTTLRERIRLRVRSMLSAGWLEEVASLESRGVRRDDPGMRAHGYRGLWDVTHGVRSLDEVEPEIALEVAQYAKRQRTWMRREPNLAKLPIEDEGATLAAALQMLWGSYDGKSD